MKCTSKLINIKDFYKYFFIIFKKYYNYNF